MVVFDQGLIHMAVQGKTFQKKWPSLTWSCEGRCFRKSRLEPMRSGFWSKVHLHGVMKEDVSEKVDLNQ